MRCDKLTVVLDAVCEDTREKLDMALVRYVQCYLLHHKEAAPSRVRCLEINTNTFDTAEVYWEDSNRQQQKTIAPVLQHSP